MRVKTICLPQWRGETFLPLSKLCTLTMFPVHWPWKHSFPGWLQEHSRKQERACKWRRARWAAARVGWGWGTWLSLFKPTSTKRRCASPSFYRHEYEEEVLLWVCIGSFSLQIWQFHSISHSHFSISIKRFIWKSLFYWKMTPFLVITIFIDIIHLAVGSRKTQMF